jgi:tRNA (cmo5U34)-methyltransferase
LHAKDAWSDKDFADKWDGRNHFRDNPDRGEQLDLLVTLLADGCRADSLILDLGSGSGRVAELIFERTEGVRVAGVDSSPSMMDIAKKRLAPWGERFIPVPGGMSELDRLDLPAGPWPFVISVQAFHEMPDGDKRKVMAEVYELLAPGGTFFLMDRVAFPGEALAESYRSVWDRLNRKTDLKDKMTYEEYWETYSAKDDHVASLGQQLSWLRAAGFEVACLYLHYNRALFAARRTDTPGGTG